MCKSKDHVPIGRGCKAVHQGDVTNKGVKVGMCQFHFWLYLNYCLGCGDPFHSYRDGAKTCSDKCRKRLSRQRHAKMFQTILSYANGERV